MPAADGSSITPPAVKVSVGTALDRRDLHFRQSFRIGRQEDCEVRLEDDCVSRAHAEVAFADGKWWVRDLGSSNGIYVGDQRIVQMPVWQRLTIRLGISGPEVVLDVEQPEAERGDVPLQGGETMVARYVQRYFSKGSAHETVGQHTMFLRKAFQQVQTKEKRKYGSIIGGLLILTLVVGAVALYQQRQIARQRATAQELFYSMKSLDVDIANVERIVAESKSQAGAAEIKKLRSRRRDMENNYDQFLATLHVYSPKMSEQDKLVLRVARIFGESELDMPKGFVDEVKRYIKKWQASDRYTKAMQKARDSGYPKPIADEFLAHGLPPQFFYLAMQESNFDPYAVGPMTRKGYAKGMWQFVPETAVKYGLHLGPLVDLSRPDPGDDRDHYDKATKAAAEYIQELYSNDAQASGMLVMACYNWGEDQVLPMVRAMPANPRERNFWRLLNEHREKIPQETYDYVFYIVSAAVIGENPRLFGFEFENPLGK
jgi:membrane-bound lytic murein transglycosylase D